MKKSIRVLGFLYLRYLTLLVLGPLFLYYNLFNNLLLALTIHPTNFLISLFYSSNVVGNLILVNNIQIELIPACVAISAYFLLLVINLITPMKPLKRVYSLLFSFVLLLSFNILRIFILSLMYINSDAYTDLIHKTLWYSLNLLIILLIWFISVWLFKIRNIPLYSDFRFIFRLNK
jgi:exosortase/archaeosortase family protein